MASSTVQAPSQPALLYTWLEHVHSVDSYPEVWAYPLHLALGKQVDTVCTHGDSTSDLPASLPVTCGRTSDHSWRMQVCCQGHYTT